MSTSTATVDPAARAAAPSASAASGASMAVPTAARRARAASRPSLPGSTTSFATSTSPAPASTMASASPTVAQVRPEVPGVSWRSASAGVRCAFTCGRIVFGVPRHHRSAAATFASKAPMSTTSTGDGRADASIAVVSTRPGGRGTAIGYAAPRHATTARARSSGPVTTPASSSPAAQPRMTRHSLTRHSLIRHAWPGTGPPRLGGGLDRPGRRVHGAARRHDRERRAALDPERPARVTGQPGMDRLRLCPVLRPGPGAGRPGRGQVRGQAALPDRADHLHPGQRGLRNRAGPGPDRRRADRPGPGRGAVLPGDRRDDPAHLHRARTVQGIRPAGRRDRGLHRDRAAARRPDHRRRRGQRRVALGVPGQPVRRRGGHPDGRLAAAHRGGAHPAQLRPGRARAADRRAAAPAHSPGAGAAGWLAGLDLDLASAAA